MTRTPKRRRHQPPVSLSPLGPEEALAGLMQVKPEKGVDMPKIKANDKVRVKPDAEHALEEAYGKEVLEAVRGKEGLIISLHPSHAEFGFRTPGSSYEAAGDDAVLWQVYFPERGEHHVLYEGWLEPM